MSTAVALQKSGAETKEIPVGGQLRLLQGWVEAHVIDANKVVVVGPVSDTGNYPFDIVLFGLLHIEGSLDTTSFAVHLRVSIIIPIWGEVELGAIDGSLTDGVKLEVGVPGIASGSITFYLENTWALWVRLELNTIVGNWDTSIYLFTIPH